MLVDRWAYRRSTGDLSSLDAEVDDALLAGQAVLEQFLDRGLEAVERTETVRIHPDGRAYVRCMPLQSVSSPANAIIRDQAILGLWPQANPSWDIVYEPYRSGPGGPGGWFDTTLPLATVTYVGGFTSTPGQPTTLPAKLQQAICDLARLELTDFAAVTAELKSASVEGVSVTYAEPPDRSSALNGILAGVRGWKRRELGF